MKIFPRPEDVIALTPNNPFDRYPDGRPRIPDDLIERLKLVTTEEAWGVMRKLAEYRFVGNWPQTHPDQIMVGRALPCTMMPIRPIFRNLWRRRAEEGRIGGQNSWVIDELQMGDVLVVDLFGKVKDGTFVGDNCRRCLAHLPAGAIDRRRHPRLPGHPRTDRRQLLPPWHGPDRDQKCDAHRRPTLPPHRRGHRSAR
ncbi:MAG: hypothetical protein R2856_03070 [Caldilineaceae bacterium]